MAFSALPRNERRKAGCTDVTGFADDIKNKLIKEKKSMKLKSKKSALLLSFTSLLLCFAMLAGSTFAWFTDTATTGVNKIVSGKLKVDIVGETGDDHLDTLKFTKAGTAEAEAQILWEPGCRYLTEGFRIANNGNLALKWKAEVNKDNITNGKVVDTAKDGVSLLDVIDFYVVTKAADGTETAVAIENFVGNLTKGAKSEVYYIKGVMQTTAGNDYQDLTLDGITITVYATQDTVENDSFNDQYDKDAEYAVEVKTADELYKALEKDDDVILTADIALPDNWTPAGNGTRSGASFTGDSYAGTFNGNGKTISNVKNSLFGVVTGTVKNVKLEAAINNTESDSVGAVAGILAGGTVSDVTVNGSVQGEEAVGGIVGRVLAEGTVSNCTNNATVESTSGSDAAGGIVGKAYYTVAGKEMNITGCKNTGTVKGKYAAGGIVGFSAANVKNCENNGTIEMSGSGASAVGGIIGEQTNYGTISGNKNTKNITVNGSTNVNVGGIIGWIRYQNNAAYANNMTIVVSDNENSGSISSGTGTGTGLGTGGIVGLAYNQAKVNGNKNTAANISGGTFAAGIVGGLQVDADNLTIGESIRFIVTGNTSATTLDNISGNCKDLFAYNNEPGNSAFADISGNTKS